jgi:hypothetical protein
VEVITSLKNMFPNLDFEEIKSVTYEQYKNKIKEALYVITFGEGFDGYYIESIFSGTVSFSVFNNSFFPDKSFLELSNIAKNSYEFLNMISASIKQTNNEAAYNDVLFKNLNKLRKFYNYNNYLKNIENFYKKKYSYNPNTPVKYYINNLINDYMARLDRYDILVNLKDKELSKMQTSITSLEQSLKDETAEKVNVQNEYQKIINSTSWQITKPFRSIRKKL